MSDSSLVLFSIGNPGPVTRHACGHIALNHLVAHLGAKQLVKSPLFSATNVRNVSLVRSNCYMNDSDKALRKFMENYKLRLTDDVVIVILYDDFEYELGQVRLSQFKKNESHNGVKSIQQWLRNEATDQVYKLGIGIGPKPKGADQNTMANWVLSPFTIAEKAVLEAKSFPLVTDYVDYILEVDGDIGECHKVNAYFKKA